MTMKEYTLSVLASVAAWCITTPIAPQSRGLMLIMFVLASVAAWCLTAEKRRRLICRFGFRLAYYLIRLCYRTVLTVFYIAFGYLIFTCGFWVLCAKVYMVLTVLLGVIVVLLGLFAGEPEGLMLGPMAIGIGLLFYGSTLGLFALVKITFDRVPPKLYRLRGRVLLPIVRRWRLLARAPKPCPNCA